MTAAVLRSAPAFVLALAGLVGLGCARREPLVPEQTQRGSEERYGQQQMMMNSLNQSPAEQASLRHENATRPIDVDDEPASSGSSGAHREE